MIPTVGPSGMFTSYWGALRTLLDYNKAVQTGYAKYRGGIFKIPIIDQWLVIVTGPQLISEVSRASEKDLSMSAATAEVRCPRFFSDRTDTNGNSAGLARVSYFGDDEKWMGNPISQRCGSSCTDQKHR